jgi:hypothetical protein
MRNALVCLLVVAACSGDAEPTVTTTTTQFDARPVVVFDRPELDDVLRVGDGRRGVAITVDGDTVTDATWSQLDEPVMPVASPDGTRTAEIDEEALVVRDAGTGEVLRRHPMESVGEPAWLSWSPDGDALYFLDLDPDSRRARRVVGVAGDGAPATVVRFGPATSFDALAVS